MSKTEEELWSRFWIINYKNQYLEESDINGISHHYSALRNLLTFLYIDIVGDELAEAVIKPPNSGNLLRKLINENKENPIDNNWTYGGKKATKWVVDGPGDSQTKFVIDNTKYELIFAKTSELLSGSGWVGNFWLVEGYFFYFPEGFSNMAGVLFKKDDQDRPIMQILIGERAYESYQEKMKQHQWDAINRRLI